MFLILLSLFILEKIKARMNRIKAFSGFITESISREKLKSLGVTGKIVERWDGGYDIDVFDGVDQGRKMDGCINISKKTPKAIGLSYLKANGAESNYFWIPLFCTKKTSIDSLGRYHRLSIPSYTNWFKDEKNQKALDDFLNSFIESVEDRKVSKRNKILEQAKEDFDMILDYLDLNDAVAELKSGDTEYFYTGLTENGLYVEVQKRTPEDLVGTFKIYRSEKDHRPSIEYSLESKERNPNFFFRVGDRRYTFYGSILDLKSSKFGSYLLKKSLGKENKDDEQSLIDYFESILSAHDWNYQYANGPAYKRGASQAEHISEVSGLLSDFLSEDKIKEIYNSYSQKG